jgi:hypothetical protein
MQEYTYLKVGSTWLIVELYSLVPGLLPPLRLFRTYLLSAFLDIENATSYLPSMNSGSFEALEVTSFSFIYSG